jgi:uncharacterized membrane protein YbhN (UPF0104 family)
MPPDLPDGQVKRPASWLHQVLSARVLIPLVASLGLLAYVSYIAAAHESWTGLWEIVRQTWAIVIILSIPYLVSRAYIWYGLLCRLGIDVPLRHLVVAFAGGEMTKSLPAGIYVENLILGKTQHLNRAEAVRSTVATTAMLGLECALAVPLIIVAGLPGEPWVRWTVVGVVVAWVLIVAIVRVLVSEALARQTWRGVRWLCQAAMSVKDFIDAGGELVRPSTALYLVPTAVYMLVYCVYLYAIAHAIGVHHLTFMQAVTAYAVIVLAVILVPIPTEIGIAEFTGFGALQTFGVSGSTAALIVLALRLVATGATILVAAIVFVVARIGLQAEAEVPGTMHGEAS